MNKKRFTIKIGKFGSYFHDTLINKDLTLDEVEDLLNLLNERLDIKLISSEYEKPIN